MISTLELTTAKENLEHARTAFNYAEGDFIEPATYALKSAESQYNYLIKRAKVEGIGNVKKMVC
jgi:hypothetical protein